MKIAAIVSLGIGVCCIVGPLMSLLQLRYQLISPIIPASLIRNMGRPFLYNAIMAAVLTSLASLFYLRKRYAWVIGIILLIIIWQRYGTLGFEG